MVSEGEPDEVQQGGESDEVQQGPFHEVMHNLGVLHNGRSEILTLDIGTGKEGPREGP